MSASGQKEPSAPARLLRAKPRVPRVSIAAVRVEPKGAVASARARPHERATLRLAPVPEPYPQLRPRDYALGELQSGLFNRAALVARVEARLERLHHLGGRTDLPEVLHAALLRNRSAHQLRELNRSVGSPPRVAD